MIEKEINGLQRKGKGGELSRLNDYLVGTSARCCSAGHFTKGEVVGKKKGKKLQKKHLLEKPKEPTSITRAISLLPSWSAHSS